jgi:DNA mismatch endonuclease, patch repair protein
VVDIFSSRERSAIMAKVRAKDTCPEMVVRRLVHGMGYRYRLHDQKLPGKPDLVFPSRRKVIFVHGCFWHKHSCRRGRRSPVANAEYWQRKRERNRVRDKIAVGALRSAGWKVLVIWECHTRDLERLRSTLLSFL